MMGELWFVHHNGLCLVPPCPPDCALATGPSPFTRALGAWASHWNVTTLCGCRRLTLARVSLHSPQPNVPILRELWEQLPLTWSL